MIIFYSGHAPKANPEVGLGNEATIMLTYLQYCKRGKADRRFRSILKARKKARKKAKK